MKKLIEDFLLIEDEVLLTPFYQKLKIAFKNSPLYDNLSYDNFCETIEIYISEFNINYKRISNRNNILLYGGF
jgi:hypothetical protein